MAKTKKSPLGKAGEMESDKVAEITNKTTYRNYSGSASVSNSKELKGKYIFKKETEKSFFNELSKMKSEIDAFLSQLTKADAALSRTKNRINKQLAILRVSEDHNLNKSEIESKEKFLYNQLNEAFIQHCNKIDEAKKPYQIQSKEMLKLSIQIVEEMLPQVVNDDKELMEEMLFRISYSLLAFRSDSNEDEYQTLINHIEPDVYELLQKHVVENKYVSFGNLDEHKQLKTLANSFREKQILST